MSTGKNAMTVMAARNGWTVKTRSGMYVCNTIDQLVRQVVSYAEVLRKEAMQQEAESKQTGKTGGAS